MEQPDACTQIDQKDPVGEYQELPQQNGRKCYINGIAAESKNTARDQFIGMFDINANTETFSEGDQAPQ